VSGEVAALGCAFFWALSSALVRIVAEATPSLALNCARSAIGAVLNIIVLAGFTRSSSLYIPSWRSLACLLLNLSIGIVIGDSLYYSSMRLIGVARSLTISASYPLLTALLSWPLLGERISPTGWAGFVLCIGGIVLVARSASPRELPAAGRRGVRGALLAGAAAICWSVGTVALRAGSTGLNVFAVNALRLTGVALLAGLLAASRNELGSLRSLRARHFLVLVSSSLTGALAGASLYVRAVQLAGAGKAALLASMAPLFSVPLAILSGERVNAQLLAGMVAAIAGMALVL
jgi:DME family drug/metabolite transporter